MRKMVWLTAVVVMLSAFDVAAQEKQAGCCLDEFVASWTAALEKGDVETAAALYAAGPDLIVVESSGRMHSGKDAARDMYRDAFTELVFTQVKLDAKASHLESDTGHAYFQLRAKGTIKADEQGFELHVQGTWYLKKVDGAWKILVEHCSPIKDTPRLKAADGR